MFSVRMRMPGTALSRGILMVLLSAFGFGGTAAAVSEPKCVAHRGNSSAELENSMRALRSAWEVGAPAVEFDVHHTRDGVAILMHDSRLWRTVATKGEGPCPVFEKIYTLKWADIDRGCKLANGEDIPTLEDVLEYFRDKDATLLLEMKDSPNLQTVGLLEDYYTLRAHLLKVISFKEHVLKWMRRYAGIQRMEKEGMQLLHLSRDEDGASLDFDGVSVHHPGRGFIDRIRRAGQVLGVWTINDRDDLRWYIRRRVDYITTNHPRRCLSVLERAFLR